MGLFARPAWEIGIASLGNLFYLTVGGVVLYFTFENGPSWVGWIAAAYFTCLFYSRSKRRQRLSLEMDRWKENVSLIERCRNEVSSDCFDPSELARRLKQQESTGLYVHTAILATLAARSRMGGG